MWTAAIASCGTSSLCSHKAPRGVRKQRGGYRSNVDVGHCCSHQLGGQTTVPEVDSELSSLATPAVDLRGFRAATKSSMPAARLRLLGWGTRAQGPARLPSDTGIGATCKALGLASRLIAPASARSLRQKRHSCLQSLRIA